ncbi:MAG TPA: DUF1634 domain-containing protein [Candidatus Baltobacteraceae bacterium]|nr:DUF1634 domain-containing protein [Candidatus Baltobacteraceae bacterium]
MSGPATTPHADPSAQAQTDELRLVVARVLLVGVALSAALVLAGLLASLAVGWNGSLVGAAPGGDPTDVGALAEGLRNLRPQAIAQLGLLTLILTPMTRVAASLVLFAIERDRTYVVVSAIVLAILLTGLLVIR